MYLIPAIDILGGAVVRLAKGDFKAVTPYHDDPVACALAFKEQGAQWLHVVDLDGARSGEPACADVISRVIAQTGLSIEVGGGIRTRAAIERMLAAGARRVILGTILVSDPDFARTAVAEYGEALCAGVDARGGRVAVQGWLETSDVPAVELAAELASWGYRHIVYTDIARDGMRSGIDAKAYEGLSRAAGLAIIASGGIATLDDLLALKACGPHVEAAIVGRAIYEGSITIPAALEALMDAACADCQPSDPCASQGGERC